MSKPLSTIVIGLIILIAPALVLPISRVTAGTPPEPEFERAWARIDGPVAHGLVMRTWIWGPDPIGDIRTEESSQAPGGSQVALYYDKARMQIPDANADPDSEGYVESGALLAELITGRVLLGDGESEVSSPSLSTVVGDPGDPNGLTYSAVGGLQEVPPFDEGGLLTTSVSADGDLVDAPGFGQYDVTAEHLAAETNHRIASVFWEFLNASGIVWNGVEHVERPLFPEPLSATGLPLTEAYWLSVSVGGVQQDVLFQCFERRCLTYTPGNPEGWQVESNNVGFHYYDWRYNQLDFDEPPEPTAEPETNLPEAVFETSDGETHSMLLEVAATDVTRACGLMHRTSLAADTGMLFVWEEDHQGSFWNCNTFVPLTLAWIDADGVIIGLTDMAGQTPGQPQNVTSYSAPGPYRYVIEANQGWFDDRGIVAGNAVDLDEALARGDTESDTLCQQLGLACN